jgi:hypothetical protein
LERAFPSLRDVMFTGIAEHSIEILAQSEISALLTLNPDGDASTVQRRKRPFLQGASCLSRDASQRVRGVFDLHMDSEFPARVRAHREQLGRDLFESARIIQASSQRADSLSRDFQNDGRCGFIADRYNDASTNSECRRLYAEWRSAERIRDEGLANYPLFSEELEGQSVLSRMAAAGSAAGALAVHDRVITRSLDAAENRVREICEDPSQAGKIAVLNPIIARSWVEQNPDSAWVFCAAHAELQQNDDLMMVARGSFTVLSILATGGWSGLFLGAASVGLTVHGTIERNEQYHRDHDEFLAGVGHVSSYLAAREGLAHFYRDAALDIGLDALGLAPELGMLRAWSRADRLASLGRMAGMASETRTALTTWYRSRLSDLFGAAARGLDEAQVAALARLEESGMDLRALARSPACRL